MTTKTPTRRWDDAVRVVVKRGVEQDLAQLIVSDLLGPRPTGGYTPDDGKRLRQMRTDAGLTRQQLAKLAGVSLSMAGYLETGSVPAKSEALDRLFAALDKHQKGKR